MTTILYAGVDSTGKMESSVQYSDKARADTIALVVMDETNQKMTILSINRDTMTKVRRYTLNGNDNGLYTTHIGFAYSYGRWRQGKLRKPLRGSFASAVERSCKALCGDKIRIPFLILTVLLVESLLWFQTMI